MAYNGIFKDGVWGCGFDMDPAVAQLFTFTPGGSFTTTGTPFGTGYVWSTSGGGRSGVLLGVNLVTLIMGVRVFTTALPGTNGLLFEWIDSTAGATQVSLRVLSTGALQFYLGSGTGTPIGSASAANTFKINQWNWIECKVTINASNGVVECRVGGNATPVITATGQNTKSTANVWLSNFSMQGPSTQTQFDDWYMLDTTGASPLNTYLGNIRAVFDPPNANSAAGSHNQFTPTNPTNVNFSNVSSIPAVATKFNSDATVNDIDFYAFPAVSGTPASILFLNEWMQLDLDNAGTRTIVPGVRSGGADTFGTQAIQPPNGPPYGLYNEPWVVDPNTSAAWTVTNAGNAELGAKINS